MKSVNVLGLGYIGLPSACLFAKNNFSVTGIDIDKNKLDLLSSLQTPFYEPKLEQNLLKAVQSGNLKFASNPQEADIHIICVPTPFRKTDKEPEPDISIVEDAFNSILPILKENNLVILESTSPIGTTEHLWEILKNFNQDLAQSIKIAYCPERVLPGNVFYELENNDRIVGGINNESSIMAETFYGHFVNGSIHKTNAKTAEAAKLAENSFRDLNIAFANQLSMLSDEIQINPFELINLCNKHPRVNILSPGSGVGGHCIAVDPWFLAYNHENTSLIKEARRVNDSKPIWISRKVESKINDFTVKHDRAPFVTFLGLAFKPNIDDFRESPALKILEHFSKHENIFAVEPFAKELITSIKLISFEDAILKSDIIIGLVKHDQFLAERLTNFSNNKIFLDYVGILE